VALLPVGGPPSHRKENKSLDLQMAPTIAEATVSARFFPGQMPEAPGRRTPRPWQALRDPRGGRWPLSWMPEPVQLRRGLSGWGKAMLFLISPTAVFITYPALCPAPCISATTTALSRSRLISSGAIKSSGGIPSANASSAVASVLSTASVRPCWALSSRFPVERSYNMVTLRSKGEIRWTRATPSCSSL
jgi:hypothetical protein